jgi:hypothetical protein
MSDQLTGLGGKNLFTISPDWSNDIKADFELSRRIFRFPGTIEVLINYSDERPGKFDMLFRFLDKTIEYDFIDFVHTQKGRWAGFWLPGPPAFFSLDDTIQDTDLQIKITKQGIVNRFRGFERCYILLLNGDTLTYKINSVAAGPGANQETLNLGAAVDRQVKQEDIAIFTLLFYVRFDKDKFQYSYVTDTISEITTQALELVKEYPA